MKVRRKKLCIVSIIFSIAIVLAFFTLRADELQSNRWEAAIQAFEHMDKVHPPNPGGVLFVGSSSIRLWKTLATDFPKMNVINRGFGGSEMADLVTFANRIVIPYQPKIIVVYSGDNDIARGKSPETVLQDFKTFVSTVHDTLLQTRIVLIAIKPSIARWDKVAEMKKANELLQQYIRNNPKLAYVDVFSEMLGKNGKPRTDLFIDDGLHLNAKGYRLWVEKVKDVLRLFGDTVK